MAIGWIIVWIVCGVAIVVAAVLANRSRRARYLGRAGVAVLFVIGGALLHVSNLATSGDYTDFADPAFFGWVTDTWRAVVAPNQLLFIGLLAAFEAAVGVLAVLGGRKTEAGYAGVIAFYCALWLFGPFELVWCIIMVPAMLLLLRAEWRATGAIPNVSVHKPPAGVGS